MLHNKFDTQNQNIWKAFLQPLKEIPEFWEGATIMISILHGSIIRLPCFVMGVNPWATMYTSMGTAMDTWPCISGAWIFSTFFRYGVYLDMHISRMTTRTFCQSCMDTLGGWGIFTACSSWRTVQLAIVGLHDPWILSCDPDFFASGLCLLKIKQQKIDSMWTVKYKQYIAHKQSFIH